MSETQIKVELNKYIDIFPIYVKILAKKLKIEIKEIKKSKNYLLINSSGNEVENYHLIENFYNFGNLFNIQKIIYSYKCETK